MRFSKRINIFLILFLVPLCAAVCANRDYPFSSSDRDPFLPLITKQGQILLQQNTGIKSLKLNGIIYSNDGSLAIISDEIYKKNDVINGYTIVRIGAKKVILKKGKELIILKLEE